MTERSRDSMPDEIRSIRIESNNICYGPEPGADDEVEQYLTISSTGRVWFSARNYQQYCNSKDYCRKKQTNIDKWKAEFLLRLIDNISENMSFVTDVESYDLEIRYSNDTKRRISGSLIGGVYSHAYGEENNVDVTRLIRRYIPVYGLWAFDGSTAPDYERKKEILSGLCDSMNEARSQLLPNEKMNEARSQIGILSWTHYRILIQVEDTTARKWYEKEAYEQVWSTTTLQRNVSSQYYYRILKSQDKQAVQDEMKKLTSSYQNKLEFKKNVNCRNIRGVSMAVSERVLKRRDEAMDMFREAFPEPAF